MLSKREFKDVHWKVQDSGPESLLFYHLSDQPQALEQFRERIRQARFKHLILNKDVPGRPEGSIVVSDAKWALVQKEACDKIYPLPKLKLMALTGTNGKTTTTDLVLQLGEAGGPRGFSVGTLGIRTQGKTIADFGLTSPSFIDLRKFLYEHGRGRDFCVMEASSHALAQDRLFGLQFDGAGFLSFSQDHLDYHETMDAYFEAKTLLFRQLKPTGKIFVPSEQGALFTRIQRLDQRVTKASIISAELPLFFRPQFNRNNLEVAAALVEDVLELRVEDYSHLRPPDGRFFIRPYGSNYIVVDFAHTPDALENVCLGIKSAFPRHKLKVLFGCGGDRDRKKRPLMGEVADRLADFSYVTSDNPRSEDPAQIIEDITQGMAKSKLLEIVERPLAVQRAFGDLAENEVLLLAGKGHEDYILRNGVKTHYSDIEEVEAFLGRKT